jgi:hypothetical protein
LRTKDDTLSELQAQHDKVMDGAPSTVETMASRCGVKDRHYVFFFEKLQEAVRRFKDPEKELTPEETKMGMKATLAKIRSQMPAKNGIFSPVLTVEGK